MFLGRRYVYISDSVVHESFQRQEIGRLLMQRVHEWANEQGMTGVELDVMSSIRLLALSMHTWGTRRCAGP
jgi:GNAT superfamily N-acetyltransferase